jgi:Ras-related protein Rab-5C
VTLGDTSTGKSSLYRVLHGDEFEITLHQTIGAEFFRCECKTLEGNSVQFELYDPAGQERYQNVVGISCRHKLIVMFCSAVNSRSSFKNLNQWICLYRDKSDVENPSIIIVATKSDLLADTPPDQLADEATALRFAEEKGATLVKTSALTPEGITDLQRAIANAKPLQRASNLPTVDIDQEGPAIQTGACCR